MTRALCRTVEGSFVSQRGIKKEGPHEASLPCRYEEGLAGEHFLHGFEGHSHAASVGLSAHVAEAENPTSQRAEAATDDEPFSRKGFAPVVPFPASGDTRGSDSGGVHGFRSSPERDADFGKAFAALAGHGIVAGKGVGQALIFKGVQAGMFVIVLCIVYAALFEVLGYVLISAIVAAIIMWLIGKRDVKQILLVSVLVPLAMWLVFYKLLTVNIPMGVLQPLRDLIDLI